MQSCEKDVLTIIDSIKNLRHTTKARRSGVYWKVKMVRFDIFHSFFALINLTFFSICLPVFSKMQDGDLFFFPIMKLMQSFKKFKHVIRDLKGIIYRMSG